MKRQQCLLKRSTINDLTSPPDMRNYLKNFKTFKKILTQSHKPMKITFNIRLQKSSCRKWQTVVQGNLSGSCSFNNHLDSSVCLRIDFPREENASPTLPLGCSVGNTPSLALQVTSQAVPADIHGMQDANSCTKYTKGTSRIRGKELLDCLSPYTCCLSASVFAETLMS